MIITVTLNPAIDRTAMVPGFAIGKTNRAIATRVAVGGKGINVARIAKRMGCRVIATGLMPRGNSSFMLAALAAAGIDTAFVEVPGEVRTNVKLIDPQVVGETEVNEPGAAADPAGIRQLEQMLAKLAAPGVAVVFSGSVPPGVPGDIYARLISLVHQQGAKAIVDTSGPALRQALCAGPELAKPNRREAEEALGWNIGDAGEAAQAALQMQSMGAGSVVISLGERGAVAALGHRLFYAQPLPLDPSARIGAGDAMVAVFADFTQRSADLLDGFRLAMAASSLAAADGFEAADFAQAVNLASRIEIQELAMPASHAGGRLLAEKGTA